MKQRWLAGCVAVLVGGCSVGSEGTDPHTEDHFRVIWFGVDHNDITEDGLSFLSDDMADDIGDYNEDTDSGDTKYQSKYHVDNCRIEDAFYGVRERYARTVSALNPANLNARQARQTFGSILHTVQDFYAHSNWVEGGQTGLFSYSDAEFPVVATGRMLGGMMVITESLPFSYTIDLPKGSRVPIVRLAGSNTTYKGLITGVFTDNKDKPICPLEASISHGGSLEQDDYGSFLAKDDPDSPHHKQAVALAKRQTTEEFCRLARMVMVRYGLPGLNTMLDVFDANRGKYDAACPQNRALAASLGG